MGRVGRGKRERKDGRWGSGSFVCSIAVAAVYAECLYFSFLDLFSSVWPGSADELINLDAERNASRN